MPYVRKRGKQVVIVRGKRNPETKKVEQQILFTIYSKAEAQQILGRSNGNPAAQFQQLLENQYPDVRFNWRKLNDAILTNIHASTKRRAFVPAFVGIFVPLPDSSC